MDRRRRVHPAAQEALNRREFLRRAAMAGIALPTAAAILAACSDPKEAAGNAGSTTIPLARREKPVTLPLYDDNPAIADGLPIEKGATLEIFNWSDYFYKKVLEEFEEEYDVKINWTTFNNMAEAKQKMQAGQVADVFFPTVDVLGQMVGAKLLQPLNHSYIPNMEANVWPAYWQEGKPFYDQGWRYTVPYVTYTTGVGYRRDVISDEEAADQGYDLLWNADYAGKVGLYDDYRETLSMAMLRDGITDINTGDQATIDAALDSLKELIPLDVRTSINGTYVGLSEGKYDVHQAWSGDMIGAQYYLPSGTSTDVLGYWYPSDHKGVVGNDLMVVPSSSQNPVLGHTFINFLLDKKHGYDNFTWNGYQPPLTSLNPETLISGGDVPESLPLAIVTEKDFDDGYSILELSPEDDGKWQDAWDEFNTSTEAEPGAVSSSATGHLSRRQKRRDFKTLEADRGAWYPRWFWPTFAAPAILWQLTFFILPFYVIIAVAFGTFDALRSPVPIFQPWYWDFTQFKEVLSDIFGPDAIYRAVYIRTFAFIILATALCLVIGYTVAYFVARHGGRRKTLFLVLLIAPFWINYLMRMFAWQSLLADDGFVNDVLAFVPGLAPVEWLSGKPFTVILGLVYGYVPYLVLPVYGQLDRISPSLLEAGRDLGASPWQTFRRVTLPLSKPALLAGMIIITLPMMGDYYTNQLLSGSPKTTMVGNIIDRSVFEPGRGALGASVVLTLIVILLIPMIYYMRTTARQAEQR